MRHTFLAFAVVLAGCSSPAPEGKQLKSAPFDTPGPASTSSKSPLAKYIELAGFRLRESGAGKLDVKFVAVNHSEADLGDLEMHIRLMTSAQKPGDEPVTEFDAKISSLGPLEIRDVEAKATTKLRLYELPDWQFLRGDFDITSPAP